MGTHLSSVQRSNSIQTSIGERRRLANQPLPQGGRLPNQFLSANRSRATLFARTMKGPNHERSLIPPGRVANAASSGIALGVALTVAAGFNWFGPGFGWATGGTVDRTANKRAETAVIAILAPICAEKFLAQPDVVARKSLSEKSTPGREETSFQRNRSPPGSLLSKLGPRGRLLG